MSTGDAVNRAMVSAASLVRQGERSRCVAASSGLRCPDARTDEPVSRDRRMGRLGLGMWSPGTVSPLRGQAWPPGCGPDGLRGDAHRAVRSPRSGRPRECSRTATEHHPRAALRWPARDHGRAPGNEREPRLRRWPAPRRRGVQLRLLEGADRGNHSVAGHARRGRREGRGPLVAARAHGGGVTPPAVLRRAASLPPHATHGGRQASDGTARRRGGSSPSPLLSF